MILHKQPKHRKKIGMVTLNEKKARYGYLFILPLLTGLIFMFGIPIIQSIIFAFSKIGISQKGFSTEWTGLTNFYNTLFIETTYREEVVKSLLNMLLNVPLIIIFSFFIANLINQKFPGRGVIRVIFFLPLVLASSALISFDTGDMLQNVMGSGLGGGFKESQSLSGIESYNLGYWLMTSGVLPDTAVQYLMGAADRIYEIVILSGVQILIFLAALQSVPREMYEVASIEGASSWESYWKITFPMVSPMMLTAVVYSIIDSFVSSTNKTVEMIQTTSFTNQNFGLSAAMAWIYFIFILAITGIVYFFMTKVVKRYES